MTNDILQQINDNAFHIQLQLQTLATAMRAEGERVDPELAGVVMTTLVTVEAQAALIRRLAASRTETQTGPRSGK